MNTEAEILDTIRQCRAMMLKDQYPEAIAQLESALRDMTDGVAWASPPLEVSLLIALVWAYERSLFRQPDPAVEERSSALQDRLESLLESADLSPVERARGWGRLGSTALLRLRWDRAARFYERLLEAVENVLGWEGYSSALLCLGRAEDALRAVERGRTHLGSLSRSPRELRALSLCFTLTQVKACLVLGRFEEAISALDELDVGSFGPSVREELQALRVVASSRATCRVDERGVLVTVDPP